MDRRTALSYLTIASGTVLISSELFLTGCKKKNENQNASTLGLQEADKEILTKISGLILPVIPGKMDVTTLKLGGFMETMLNDCYKKGKQEEFKMGWAEISNFINQSDQKFEENGQIFNYLKELDKVANNKDEKSSAKKETITAMKIIKELTLLGYFTSEEALTKDMKYERIPMRFNGSEKLPENKESEVFGLG